MIRNSPKQTTKEMGTSDSTIKIYRNGISRDSSYKRNETNNNSKKSSQKSSHSNAGNCDKSQGE